MELILVSILRQEVKLIDEYECIPMTAKEKEQLEPEKPEFNSSNWKKNKTISSSASRIIRKDATCVIMLSGLIPSKEEPYDDMANKIGGVLVDTFDKTFSNVTHVVADRVKRTAKFLASINKGFHIVPEDWLIDCAKEEQLLDPEN